MAFRRTIKSETLCAATSGMKVKSTRIRWEKLSIASSRKTISPATTPSRPLDTPMACRPPIIFLSKIFTSTRSRLYEVHLLT